MEDIKGLGDQIEKITEATGIKKLVKWAFGEDCGCDQRKEKLNKLFPLKFQIFSNAVTMLLTKTFTDFFLNLMLLLCKYILRNQSIIMNAYITIALNK